MSALTRMSAAAHSAQKSSEVTPSLHEALRSLEAGMDVVASQAPTDISWEAVSESHLRDRKDLGRMGR